ncbi:hypothetical protein FB451DRAFT_1167717 [Mycena latifolia]|nr:hypothetical protein FB451DRAFT_1167717 [Mycena latifolia]
MSWNTLIESAGSGIVFRTFEIQTVLRETVMLAQWADGCLVRRRQAQIHVDYYISPSWQPQRPEDFREGTPPPRTWICGDWYTDPTEGWASLRLFEETVDGKLKIKKLFDDVFDVPGTVEPLAYLPGTGGEVFLFAAGGRYYLFSDGRLTVHRMQFASPKDFLAHVLQPGGGHMPDVNVPMRPGTNLNWW